MKHTHRNTHIAAALLLALACTAPATALAQSDSSDRDAMERARKQVEQAREELRKATRELARSMVRVEKDNPRAQYFEFMTNPDRPIIGIIIGDAKEKLDDSGVRVLAVTPGGGAEKAGLEAGDVILSLNGKSLAATKDSRPEDLMREQMHKLKAGDKIKVEYSRDGRKQSATITTQPPEPDFAMSLIPPLPPEALLGLKDEEFEKFTPPFAKMFSYRNPATRGLELAKLDDDLSYYFKTKDGVLVIKAPESDTLGLKSGDVIQKIDGSKVSEPLTVIDKLRARSEERSVRIELIRRGKTQTVQSKIPVADAGKHTMKYKIIINDDHDLDINHEFHAACDDDDHDHNHDRGNTGK